MTRPLTIAMLSIHSSPLGVLGTFRVARRNILELIPEIATRQPMVSGKTGVRWHMVMDPGANRRILRDAEEDYPKSDVTKLILGPAIGNSLFIAEGAHWRWQRRAAAPARLPILWPARRGEGARQGRRQGVPSRRSRIAAARAFSACASTARSR